jgi:hypothetical protein
VLEHTKALGYKGRDAERVWKEVCYGKAEMLRDAEKAARWWRDNLVHKGCGLRYCDVGQCGVVVLIRRWVDGV